MNKLNTDQLFEIVRTAPTELSKDQVAGFIQTIPTLPGGGGGGSWFQNFNLNSIIMTTTAVTIVGSALIYLMNGAPDPQIPEPEVMPVTPQEIVSDSIQEQIVEEVQTPEQTEKTVVAQESPETNPTSSEVSEEVVPTQTTDTDVSSNSNTSNGTSDAKRVVSTQPDRADHITQDEELVSIQSARNKSIYGLNSAQMRRLKREVLRYLAKDGLARKNDINALAYSESGFSANEKALPESLFIRYKGLMDKYGLQPGANFQIVTHPDYIQVGEFTPDGFRGQGLGKNMDIKFIDDRVIKNGLFDDTNNAPNAISELPSPELFASSGESILNEKPGVISRAKPPSSSSDILIPSSGPKHTTGIKTPAKSKGKNLELSGRDAKRLKRILYYNMVNDDLIPERGVNVRMLTKPRSLEVNGHALTRVLRAKYAKILNDFNVERVKNSKILMSSDFIFVGKFEGDKFHGTAQGKMNSESVVGNILEQDLMHLSLFNGDYHPENSLLSGAKKGQEAEDFLATEEREIAEFNNLVAKGVAVVYISSGKHQNAKLKVRGMPIEDVTTNVHNGVLKIDTKGNPQGESIEVYVSSPNLEEIEVSGAAEVYSDNFITADFLKISSLEAGAAYLKLEVNDLLVNLGGGDLELKGKTKYMDVLYLRGADRGSFEYYGLKVEEKDRLRDKDDIIKDELQNLRIELVNQLFEDRFIKSKDEEITVDFSRSGLRVNDSPIPESRMNEYRGLMIKYGIVLKNERKIFTREPFIILVDRENTGFKYLADSGGPDVEVNLKMKGTWAELKNSIFKENR